MMTTRPLVLIVSATSMTAMLLFCMTLLIGHSVAAPIHSPRVIVPAASTPPPEPPPNTLQKPIPPPPPATPPRPGDSEHTIPAWPTPTVISPPGNDGPTAPFGTMSIDGIDLASLDDGPAVEIMPVQPIYPGRMLARGVEGSVIVTFEVDTSGAVVNAAVTSSTHQGFESAALTAIQRFKFQPRMVDGAPVTTRAMSKQFRFSIER